MRNPLRLFYQNIPYTTLEKPARQKGEFFPHLVGFNILSIDGKWIEAEPIYIPRLRIQRRAGQVWIEINSDRPLVYITLQGKRPWIYIFRFPWESPDEER
jgi:hypothetical protein